MIVKIYLVCLATGVLYSLVSVIANGILESLDFEFNFNFMSLPLKPFTIMSFVTIFGGVGLIALRFMPVILTPIPAVASGYVISKLLYDLFYVKLRKYETEAIKENDALLKEAEVVEKILPGSYGKISYVIDGTTLSAAAKEETPGNGISKGRKVTIVSIKDNVYYVAERIDIKKKTIVNEN